MLTATVNGVEVKAIIDSGATISVIAKQFVPDNLIHREDAIPVQVANGQTAFTMGTTVMMMKFDQTLFEQKAHVLETSAFEAILGLDFLSGNPRCGGVLTQPPPERLIFDQKQFQLSQCDTQGKVHHVMHIKRRSELKPIP